MPSSPISPTSARFSNYNPSEPPYPTMSRIEREKDTIRLMIRLYARHKLKAREVPEEYRQLADYACRRLDHCTFGERKTACKDCPIHCYAPERREKIREVMRWVGPRMFLYAPLIAIRHLLEKRRARTESRR